MPYDHIYAQLLPDLAKCDIVAHAKRLGLTPEDDGSVSADFLGRTYKITNQAADVSDGGDPVHINNRSLLIHYILSDGGIEPKNSFVPLSRLTGTIDGKFDRSDTFSCATLLRETGGKYDVFAAAAEELGGTFIEKSLGGYCWQFDVFPKMPIRLIFFEADEEFPAELKIQFDETAPYYMDFECLAFLSGSLIQTLLAIIEKNK